MPLFGRFGALRIVILGPAGSGKSTLARKLGEVLRTPVICLDDIWQPDWGPDDVPAFRALLKGAHRGDAWISDGNFAVATFDIRLPRATLILWLDRPRLVCSWRALRRVFGSGSGHRLRHLPRVWRYIWTFDAKNRPLIEGLRLQHGAEVPLLRLTSSEEITGFLCSAGTSAAYPARSA